MAHDVTELKHPPDRDNFERGSCYTVLASGAPGPGSFPRRHGPVRSGYFNTLDDVELAIKAARKSAAKMESFGDA